MQSGKETGVVKRGQKMNLDNRQHANYAASRMSRNTSRMRQYIGKVKNREVGAKRKDMKEMSKSSNWVKQRDRALEIKFTARQRCHMYRKNNYIAITFNSGMDGEEYPKTNPLARLAREMQRAAKAIGNVMFHCFCAPAGWYRPKLSMHPRASSTVEPRRWCLKAGSSRWITNSTL